MDTLKSRNRVSPAATHTDFALHWLRGISSIAVCGLRFNTVRCMPYRPRPLRFSVSITYQKEREKIVDIEISFLALYNLFEMR